jgi:hypothetical protein
MKNRSRSNNINNVKSILNNASNNELKLSNNELKLSNNELKLSNDELKSNNNELDENLLNKNYITIDDKSSINDTKDKYGGAKNKRAKNKKGKESIDDEQLFKEVSKDKIHTFIHKPIIIGNKALEIYGFPVKQQEYIDCVIHQDDYEILKKKDKLYKFKDIKKSPYHNLTTGLTDEDKKINFITNIYIYNYEILAVEALEKDPFDISCLDYIILIKILKSMDPKLKQYKEKHLNDIEQVTKVLYTFC